MRFNPKSRIDPGSISDGGSSGGGGGFGGGGGGMRLPIPTGGGSLKMTIIIMVIYFLIQMCSGAKLPGPDLGQGDSPQTPTQQQPAGEDASCKTGADANESPYDCGIGFLATSVQQYWRKTLQGYKDAGTTKFTGQVQSGCGTASAQMGPFYCPNDQRIYIDTTFMKNMLEGQLDAKGGAFALGYVIAHEYGHHVENLLGYLGRARTQQGPESDGVKIELMADCLAGMWAKDAGSVPDANGNVIIEDLTQDDIARAIDAAKHVGDDYIQERSGGQVDPESWTHGSSAQREKWFNIGLQEGSLKACDTWSADTL